MGGCIPHIPLRVNNLAPTATNPMSFYEWVMTEYDPEAMMAAFASKRGVGTKHPTLTWRLIGEGTTGAAAEFRIGKTTLFLMAPVFFYSLERTIRSTLAFLAGAGCFGANVSLSGIFGRL